MSIPKLVSNGSRLLVSKGNSNIFKSPFRNIEVANTTIPEHVWKNLDKWPDKTAIICGVTKRSYTYHQLYKKSRNFAANLRKKFDVKDGDAVCVMLHNCPEYPIVALGVLQAGAVLTTCNPVCTKYELQRNITLSDPKLIIGSPITLSIIKESLIQAKKILPVITLKDDDQNILEDTVRFQEVIEETDDNILKDVKKAADDLAILPFSSGTTGVSKAVELTSKSIVTNYLQQDVDEVKQYNDTTSSYQESIVAVLPFSHIYGLSLIMLHKLSVGAKIVSLPKFKPDSFLLALKEHKVSLLYAAPPLVLFLGSQVDIKKEHLKSVNKVINGAAPVPKHDVDRLMDKTKPHAQFSQVYGSTEALLVTSTGHKKTDYSSCGHALSNTELKVVDQNSEALGPNEVGELLIKGPQLMKGYKNNEEATQSSNTDDGWFRSGDLAKIDEGGTVTIVDRLKEVIKVKGYQVPPVELENILKEHPAILDAGVIGVPDSRQGETPKAFIVLKEGQRTDEKDVIDFVSKRVAEYKAIKKVEFLKELPKSASGKLLRRVLKKDFVN